MPTEKPRVTITVSPEQLEQIESYRYGHKMKNQTQAILSLVEKGFSTLESQEAEAIKKASETPSGAPEANHNMDLFADVLTRAGIIAPGGDITASDAEFLKAMLIAIKAHFQKG